MLLHYYNACYRVGNNFTLWDNLFSCFKPCFLSYLLLDRVVNFDKGMELPGLEKITEETNLLLATGRKVRPRLFKGEQEFWKHWKEYTGLIKKYAHFYVGRCSRFANPVQLACENLNLPITFLSTNLLFVIYGGIRVSNIIYGTRSLHRRVEKVDDIIRELT